MCDLRASDGEWDSFIGEVLDDPRTSPHCRRLRNSLRKGRLLVVVGSGASVTALAPSVPPVCHSISVSVSLE